MKKLLIVIIIALICISNNIFSQVKYTNPILEGFYSDPSICRVNNDYYLVTSTFAYFPGLPVFHSKDLVNWQQIGNAMNRNTQFKIGNANVSGGLFAPAIRYHDGLFYIMYELLKAYPRLTLIDIQACLIFAAESAKHEKALAV